MFQGNGFPEVRKDPQLIKDIINEEEAQFLKTLRRGRAVLERTFAKVKDTSVFPGKFRQSTKFLITHHNNKNKKAAKRIVEYDIRKKSNTN